MLFLLSNLCFCLYFDFIHQQTITINSTNKAKIAPDIIDKVTISSVSGIIRMVTWGSGRYWNLKLNSSYIWHLPIFNTNIYGYIVVCFILAHERPWKDFFKLFSCYTWISVGTRDASIVWCWYDMFIPLIIDCCLNQQVVAWKSHL